MSLHKIQLCRTKIIGFNEIHKKSSEPPIIRETRCNCFVFNVLTKKRICANRANETLNVSVGRDVAKTFAQLRNFVVDS